VPAPAAVVPAPGPPWPPLRALRWRLPLAEAAVLSGWRPRCGRAAVNPPPSLSRDRKKARKARARLAELQAAASRSGGEAWTARTPGSASNLDRPDPAGCPASAACCIQVIQLPGRRRRRPVMPGCYASRKPRRAAGTAARRLAKPRAVVAAAPAAHASTPPCGRVPRPAVHPSGKAPTVPYYIAACQPLMDRRICVRV